MEPGARIYVAGGDRMVGSAIVRALRASGCERVEHGRDDEDPAALLAGVEYLFIASGRAHGIQANIEAPADIMVENLFFECPLIRAAHEAGVRKLVYVASSCCYPRDCPQPMAPSAIFSGPPEPTNHAYSMAKLAALSLCQAYRRQYGDRFLVVIPATPFGTGDDFDPRSSHVVAALMRRLDEARALGSPTFSVWGSGRPRRDFVFADDLADALVFLMTACDGEEVVNVATESDLSIAALAEAVREVVGYTGEIRFDTTKPDGAPVKILDTQVIQALGWSRRTPLRDALQRTYDWYRRQAVASV